MAAEIEEAAAEEASSWNSDESSFYGDDEEKTLWEHRLRDSDEQENWDTFQRLIHGVSSKSHPSVTIGLHKSGHAGTSRKTAGEEVAENVNRDVDASAGKNIESTSKSTTLHNPLEGRRNAKQLDETVSDFIKRAPALDSLWADDGWLWVANPHAKPREISPDLEGFIPIGEQYLNDYLEQREQLQSRNPDKPAGIITRMLKPARDKLKADIEKLAATCHVTSGKWLLFPHVDDVPTTWRTVVEAVTESRLGDLAKIATGTDKREDDGIRVICIYTADFTDESDVRRVCRSLDDLGLVPDRGIWYKADAYTHLNITRDNKYNIPPTSYSSKDILTRADPQKGTKRAALTSRAKEPARKKQATLDWSF